jgi:tRNA (cytidine/uridine-2'-O-)-methyltransferase
MSDTPRQDPSPTLSAHRLKLALMQPQIAPNTGNIARLCVATSTELHLVRPLGFVLSDRELRRSAMDYWPRLKLTVHDDDAAFFTSAASAVDRKPGKMWLFTSKSSRPFWDATFAAEDWLVFGNETAGLPTAMLSEHADRCLRIPQVAGERCLNLSTATGIALYEALRQVARAQIPAV